jgi:sulfhydrogenase subunit beta (sulfur reductase)
MTVIDEVTSTDPPRFMSLAGLGDLLGALQRRGYTVVGPTIRQEAIVYDHIHSVDDFPRGWTDRQEPGRYRLERRDDHAYFGYVVGPQSWKQFLFPPVATISTAVQNDAGWQVEANQGADAPQYAFLGMRACELAAVAIQDRVFRQSSYVDPIYAARRDKALFIAVNCSQAAPTCFCVSMQTGPRCTRGFDLVLTELDDGFVIESGSVRGEEILAELATIAANTEHLQQAEVKRSGALEQSRSLPKDEVRDILLNNLQHPRWQEVAERCLSCTNCTQVCPTCFCSSVQEVTDLDVTRVERQRTWDSCFNLDFSYMNGGAVRNTVRSRYRQWLTHKLATWHDQFDTSGCVGCGRCIAWCPVGIDLTVEVAAIRGEQP